MAQFRVLDRKNNWVDAKPLTDYNGNVIFDPETGMPYQVPQNFDFEAALAWGHSIAGRSLLEKKRLMEDAFNTYSGFLDAQRTRDGKPGGQRGEFVNAFRPSASYIFGAVSQAADVPEWMALAGGGRQNRANKQTNSSINMSGDIWGNAPVNLPNIKKGFNDYNGGKLTAQPPAPILDWSLWAPMSFPGTDAGKNPPRNSETWTSLDGNQPPPEAGDQQAAAARFQQYGSATGNMNDASPHGGAVLIGHVPKAAAPGRGLASFVSASNRNIPGAYDIHTPQRWQPQQQQTPEYSSSLLSLLLGNQQQSETAALPRPQANSYPKGATAGSELLRALLQMPQQWT